ncbi:MAG: hypothetical protein KDK41_08920 [Leptospiraceae bacterium]|nr:hypothetical protein [Leptospiraceae bacterium]
MATLEFHPWPWPVWVVAIVYLFFHLLRFPDYNWKARILMWLPLPMLLGISFRQSDIMSDDFALIDDSIVFMSVPVQIRQQYRSSLERAGIRKWYSVRGQPLAENEWPQASGFQSDFPAKGIVLTALNHPQKNNLIQVDSPLPDPRILAVKLPEVCRQGKQCRISCRVLSRNESILVVENAEGKSLASTRVYGGQSDVQLAWNVSEEPGTYTMRVQLGDKKDHFSSVGFILPVEADLPLVQFYYDTLNVALWRIAGLLRKIPDWKVRVTGSSEKKLPQARAVMRLIEKPQDLEKCSSSFLCILSPVVNWTNDRLRQLGYSEQNGIFTGKGTLLRLQAGPTEENIFFQDPVFEMQLRNQVRKLTGNVPRVRAGALSAGNTLIITDQQTEFKILNRNNEIVTQSYMNFVSGEKEIKLPDIGEYTLMSKDSSIELPVKIGMSSEMRLSMLNYNTDSLESAVQRIQNLPDEIRLASNPVQSARFWSLGIEADVHFSTVLYWALLLLSFIWFWYGDIYRRS